MFARLIALPKPSSTILRRAALGWLALACAFPATAAPVCKPDLAFRQVDFSPINYETMKRRWSAKMSVDASRCATMSGDFAILFTLWSETAPDNELTRTFTWAPGQIEVMFDVTANEAIGGYRLQNIGTCPCRK